MGPYLSICPNCITCACCIYIYCSWEEFHICCETNHRNWSNKYSLFKHTD
ncbi:hypothetical protein PAHAL_9G530600 [Panicum hallii]|uniref:Uncharacterized protein n=1 Tax=Panicum hallii TaxID=206008 RepID=A0A2S3ITA4_9POAL|nr:hypothetical protein PAHAL_9G530600 [Panicum hallii]